MAERLENKPDALSGGEQQRVAVARALINNPKIIFADEPPAISTQPMQKNCTSYFLISANNSIKHFLIVTHNEELAQMSDRILHMKDGKII